MPFTQLRLTPQQLARRLGRDIAQIEAEINALGAALKTAEGLKVEQKDLRLAALRTGANIVLSAMFSAGALRAASSLDTWWPLDGDNYSFKKDLARQCINTFSTTATAVFGNLLCTGVLEPLFNMVGAPSLHPIQAERLAPVGAVPAAASNNLADQVTHARSLAACTQLQQEINLAQQSLLNPSMATIPLALHGGQHFIDSYRGTNALMMALSLCVHASLEAYEKYSSVSAPIRIAIATGAAGFGALSAGIVTASHASSAQVIVPTNNRFTNQFPNHTHARTHLFEAGGGANANSGRPFNARNMQDVALSIYTRIGALLTFCSLMQLCVLILNATYRYQGPRRQDGQTSVLPDMAKGMGVFTCFLLLLVNASLYFRQMSVIQFEELKRLWPAAAPQNQGQNNV